MIYLFIWLHWVFVAARGLSAVVVSRGHSRVAARTLLIVEASLLVEHMDSRAVDSVVVALSLVCSRAGGIFQDQGSHLCSLH